MIDGLHATLSTSFATTAPPTGAALMDAAKQDDDFLFSDDDDGRERDVRPAVHVNNGDEEEHVADSSDEASAPLDMAGRPGDIDMFHLEPPSASQELKQRALKSSNLHVATLDSPGVNPKDIYPPAQKRPAIAAIGSAPDSIATTMLLTSQSKQRSSPGSRTSKSSKSEEQSRRTSPRKASQTAAAPNNPTSSQRRVQDDLAKLATMKKNNRPRPKATVTVEKARAEQTAKAMETLPAAAPVSSRTILKTKAMHDEDGDDELLLRPSKKAKTSASTSKPVSKASTSTTTSSKVIEIADSGAESEDVTDEEVWLAKETTRINDREDDLDADFGSGTGDRWKPKKTKKADPKKGKKAAAPAPKSKAKPAPKAKGKAKAVVDDDETDDDVPVVARGPTESVRASKPTSATASRRQSNVVRDSTADLEDEVAVTTTRKTSRLPETLSENGSSSRKPSTSSRKGKEKEQSYRTSEFVQDSDAGDGELEAVTETEEQPQAAVKPPTRKPTATYGKKGTAAASQAAKKKAARATIADSDEDEEEIAKDSTEPARPPLKKPSPPTSHIEVVIEQSSSRKPSSSTARPEASKAKAASPPKPSSRASRSTTASQSPEKQPAPAASAKGKKSTKKAVVESDEDKDDEMDVSEAEEASDEEEEVGKKAKKPAAAKKASPVKKAGRAAEKLAAADGPPKAIPLAAKDANTSPKKAAIERLAEKSEAKPAVSKPKYFHGIVSKFGGGLGVRASGLSKRGRIPSLLSIRNAPPPKKPPLPPPPKKKPKKGEEIYSSDDEEERKDQPEEWWERDDYYAWEERKKKRAKARGEIDSESDSEKKAKKKNKGSVEELPVAGSLENEEGRAISADAEHYSD